MLFGLRSTICSPTRVSSAGPTVRRPGALGTRLANVPVALIVEPPPPVRAAGLTSGRAALGIAWFAALVAAVAVGVTLRIVSISASAGFDSCRR